MLKVLAIIAFLAPLAAAAGVSPITVEPSELAMPSHKYDGKMIRVHRVHCYYGDVHEFRCTGLSQTNPFAIFGDDVEDRTSRNWIEAKCNSILKALRSKDCLSTITFVYDGAFVEAASDRFAPRTIIRTHVIYFQLPSF